MNLQNLTITSTGDVHVLDSLNAALLQLKVKREASTTQPNDNTLVVYVDTQPSNNPTSNRRQFVFELDDVLKYYNQVSDEFMISVAISNNDAVFDCHVERKIGENNTILANSTLEEVEPIAVVLFEGENYIYTNYTGANITVVYPKDTDTSRLLLLASIFAGHRKDDGGNFTIDDVYFKDAFTKTGDNLNLEVNLASVDAIQSNDGSSFSLDDEGNLIVKSISIANLLKINNNQLNLDSSGNLSVTGNITGNGLNVYSITSRNSGKFSMDSNGNLSVKSLNVNGTNITGSGSGPTQSEICNFIYPVGSIYMSVNSTNPGTLFGGTWVAWGTGCVPVGINTGDSDFSTVEKTGGAKSHVHTVGGHFHNLDGSNSYAQVNFTGGRSYLKGRSRSAWTPTDALTGTSTYSSKPSNSWGADVVGKTQNSSEFNTGTTNNLMPYITCYMWKRTA